MKTLATLFPLLLLALPGWARGEDAVTVQTLQSKGVPISYTVEGKGPPVVLIHGLFATADLNWRLPGVIKLLAEDYQVNALDVRGHGRSGKPEKEGVYGVEMADDVVRLLNHLKIKKAHVIGYSMGGMIAMKLMTRHPERVSSAILGGMGWLREGTPLQDFWSRLPQQKGGIIPAACIRSLGELAVREDEVKAIQIPVAVLVGDRDPCRWLYVTSLTQVRRDWNVTVIDRSDHLSCVIMPQFKEELKKRLDQEAKR